MIFERVWGVVSLEFWAKFLGEISLFWAVFICVGGYKMWPTPLIFTRFSPIFISPLTRKISRPWVNKSILSQMLKTLQSIAPENRTAAVLIAVCGAWFGGRVLWVKCCGVARFWLFWDKKSRGVAEFFVWVKFLAVAELFVVVKFLAVAEISVEIEFLAVRFSIVAIFWAAKFFAVAKFSVVVKLSVAATFLPKFRGDKSVLIGLSLAISPKFSKMPIFSALNPLFNSKNFSK